MAHVKFIVLTSSRTGSTWLIDVLNSQPGVQAHGELFLPRRRLQPAIAGRDDYRRFIDVYGKPGLARMPLVISYLNELFRSPSIVGFKLMYTQLRAYPEIYAYMALRRIRIVHLVRCNHIDVLVSEELARFTGASHAKAGESSEVPMVYLNPADLIRRLRSRSKAPEIARQLLCLSTCSYLETTYESLLDGATEFGRIFDFLDITMPDADLRSKLQKRGARGHRDAIANYDEVMAILSTTPYARLLR